MVYEPELYYLQDEKDFPFRDALRLTATTVSRWCSHYHAELLAPEPKDIVPKGKSGPLPTDPQEKEAFVAELVSWILENSLMDSLFRLLLDDEPVLKSGGGAKFAYYDDTCSWSLDLTESEFAELQSAWQGHSLPQDLFYPQGKSVCVPYPGTGLMARLFRATGGQRCYTPKRWERAQLAESEGLASPSD
jgi:hypothetical protein